MNENSVIIRNAIDQAEDSFKFQELLQSEYFKKYRRTYEHYLSSGRHFCVRNYLFLIQCIEEIDEYNGQHIKSFIKRFRNNQNDWRNCEAIFSEMIVYRYYIRLVYEGLIRKIEMYESEADIIIHRNDGTKAYMEVFCVMPNFKTPELGKFIIQDVKTHTQDEFASIRQKLLRKISKQKQLSSPRENYAVIELNDSLIACDFAILSSLSSGYKLTINKKTMKVVSEGYDWSESIFNDPSTQFLKGIIYFGLGDYGSRKYLDNPFYQSNSTEQIAEADRKRRGTS